MRFRCNAYKGININLNLKESERMTAVDVSLVDRFSERTRSVYMNTFSSKRATARGSEQKDAAGSSGDQILYPE